MDKPVDRGQAVQFGPDRRLTALVFAAAAVALGLALTADTGETALLFGIAAALLLGYAVTDLLFWPRLAADASGLRIRTPLARADLGWDEVDAVRADVRHRHGIRSVTLEVDAGTTLVVFSRRALGADPAAVSAAVRAVDPRRRENLR